MSPAQKEFLAAKRQAKAFTKARLCIKAWGQWKEQRKAEKKAGK